VRDVLSITGYALRILTTLLTPAIHAFNEYLALIPQKRLGIYIECMRPGDGRFCGISHWSLPVQATSVMCCSTTRRPTLCVCLMQLPKFRSGERRFMEFCSCQFLRVFSTVIAVLSLSVVLGCQGVTATQNSGSVSSAAGINTAISPTQATVEAGLSEQFSAVVTGTANTAVTWLVNGAPGGNGTGGTINSSGIYVAPQVVPAEPVSVTARSVADSASSAAAKVTVVTTAAPIEFAISPVSASLSGNQSQQFTAIVTGTSNTAVNWSVNNVVGGNADLGTISSTGLYTTPACSSLSDVTVTATSGYDSTAIASAAVTLSAAGAVSGHYYVATTGNNVNDGSPCHPWASIEHASTQVSPGSIVHVAPGTYAGPITTSANGTASSRIRYISDTQWGAIYRCSGNCDMVWTQRGNYVDVLGFAITSTDPLTRIGIEWTGGNGLVQGNKVHDIQCSGCVGNGGAGINVDNGSAYTAVDSNVVYNIDAAGKGHADSLYVHGIYVHTYYNSIRNNLVYNCAGWGVEQGHEVSNSTIVNNTIFKCGGGIMIGTGGSSGNSDNNLINNNVLVYNGPGYNGHGNGIDAIANYGVHNTIANNLFYGNQPSNISSALNGYATISGSITNVAPASGSVFVNWQPNGSGDYHLKAGSAAINAGTSTAAPPLDIDGGKRPTSGAWDIGAYEYGSADSKWPWD
jgi:hypothetical protein